MQKFFIAALTVLTFISLGPLVLDCFFQKVDNATQAAVVLLFWGVPAILFFAHLALIEIRRAGEVHKKSRLKSRDKTFWREVASIVSVLAVVLSVYFLIGVLSFYYGSDVLKRKILSLSQALPKEPCAYDSDRVYDGVARKEASGQGICLAFFSGNEAPRFLPFGASGKMFHCEAKSIGANFLINSLTNSQAIEMLKKFKEERKNLWIENIALVGHGNVAKITVGEERASLAFFKALSEINGKNYPKPNVIIFQCSVARTQEGEKYCQDISDFFGLRILAPQINLNDTHASRDVLQILNFGKGSSSWKLFEPQN